MSRYHTIFQLCRDIFEHRSSLSKEYYDTDVEVVCDANSGNGEALECIKRHTDLTAVSDAKKCNYISISLRSFIFSLLYNYHQIYHAANLQNPRNVG